MKIKRITLFNIGPYIDLNTFDITIAKDKNIVLIGGKNGAGKTTFFKAIKTCLYGSRVWGFDAPGKEYFAIVNGLVNTKTLYDNTAKAYIEIELVFDDGKQINHYVLHREWKKIKQTFSEYFNVRKNGDLIIGQEEDDFINYLLSVIPPDMFNFYFFDGESIAEFFLGSDGNKNFRNAFLKLYGLDTLSIMVENFARNIKKTDVKNSTYDSFLEARATCEREEVKYNLLQDEIRELENKIDLCQIQMRSLQADYTKNGGIGLADWKELNAQILKEENKIAIALSLRNSDHLTEEDFESDGDGLELNRQTITGEYDDIFKALIISHSGEKLDDNLYFPKYLKAHIDRGTKFLYAEYKYSNGNFYKHLLELDKGI